MAQRNAERPIPHPRIQSTNPTKIQNRRARAPIGDASKKVQGFRRISKNRLLASAISDWAPNPEIEKGRYVGVMLANGPKTCVVAMMGLIRKPMVKSATTNQLPAFAGVGAVRIAMQILDQFARRAAIAL